MKLKKITIEGLHATDRKTYEFSDFNYIVGPNGSGKTTILNAIQLALLGYIPGTDKKKSAIYQHAGGTTLSVTAYLDNNGQMVSVKRIWAGVGKDIITNVEVSPNGYDISNILSGIELPIFNFNELLGLTANKMKDWFIEFLPSTDVDVDWRRELAASVESEFDGKSNLIESAVSSIQSQNISGMDSIRWANNFFKQGLSFKKAELDRNTKTIQSLIYYDDVTEDVSLESILRRISELQRRKSDMQQVNYIKSSNEKIQNTIDSLYADCTYSTVDEDPRFIDLSVKWNDVQQKLNTENSEKLRYEYVAKSQDLTRQISEVEADIRSYSKVLSSNGVCPYTDSKCESIQNLREEYTVASNDAKMFLDTLKSNLKVLEENESARIQSIRNLTDTRAKLESSISAICAKYEKLDTLRSQIQMVPFVPDSDKNVDYDAEIERLQSLRSKYEANQRYNNLITELTKSKFELENEVNAYKSWVNLTGVNGLQTQSDSANPFDELASKMSEIIEPLFGRDCKCKFNLVSKANSFSFGLDRNGEYIPYEMLSSGEKCMYSLAFMLSILSYANCPLKLILVDDSFDHLDDSNLNKLFNSLYDVEGIQMIFAGVKKIDVPESSGRMIRI